MPACLRRLFLLLVIPTVAASCRGGEERMPTFPARGQLFVNSQPADGAVVILRPKDAADAAQADKWTSGFPRAVVQSDGAFTVGTYESDDGAPAGEYIVLVQWPTASAADEDPETATPDGEASDRLQGRYLDPAKSQLGAVIKEQESNDLGRLDLK